MKNNYTDGLMEEIYADYLENCDDHASKEIIGTREALDVALENYLAAIQEAEFIRGFRHAVSLAEKEVL